MPAPEDPIESGNGLSRGNGLPPTPRLHLAEAPHTFPGMLILSPGRPHVDFYAIIRLVFHEMIREAFSDNTGGLL